MNTSTNLLTPNVTMSDKIRRMSGRAKLEVSRPVYHVSDVTRWLGTDEKHFRKLLATLNCRENLNVLIEGRKVLFAEIA